MAAFQGHEVEKVTANYWSKDMRFDVEYRWGAPPIDAMREVEKVVSSYSAQMPEEIRDSLSIWTNADNAGFFALSYYSETRSLDELYKFLEWRHSSRRSMMLLLSSFGIQPGKKFLSNSIPKK